MKINRLLTGTLALVLVAGFVSPVFAQLNSGETLSSPEEFTPSAATPAAVGEVLIDFETFPDTTPIPDGALINTQFVPVGVDLVTSSGGDPSIIQIFLAGQSGVNVLVPFGTFSNPIGFEFAGCNTDVSILALDIGFDGLILEAFNAGNVLVDSDSFTDPTGLGLGNVNTLSVSGNNIVRINIQQIIPGSNGDGYAIDDLRFTQCLVGGESLQIDSTALILAGAQSFSWMIPVVLSVLGIGLFVVSRKNELAV